jgi:hypothetical protein
MSCPFQESNPSRPICRYTDSYRGSSGIIPRFELGPPKHKAEMLPRFFFLGWVKLSPLGTPDTSGLIEPSPNDS